MTDTACGHSAWTNGTWTIRWIDEEHVEITDGTPYRLAVMCGGGTQI